MGWKFFMSPLDVPFWIRSAQTDAQLQRLRRQHDEARSFDLLYAKRGDPWGLSSPKFRYQQDKYDSLVSLLPKLPYSQALDLGCGLGDLTIRLAQRADRVLGIDMSGVAIEQARRKTSAVCNVDFQQGDVLNLSCELDDSFDLVVVADTLYYLSPLSDKVLEIARQRVTRTVKPGGILMLVNHFIAKIDPGSRWSPRIHQAFRHAPDLTVIQEHRRPFYLVSIFQKRHA